MSKDYSLLPLAARLPLTGSAGDTVRMHSPCRVVDGLWKKEGCDFSASSGRFGGGGMQFTSSDCRLLLIAGAIGSGDATGDFTMECFFRAGTVARSYQAIMGEDSSAVVGLKLDKITFYASGVYQITGPSVSINTWHHVALCKLGGTITLYFNGVGTSVARNVRLNLKYIGGDANPSESFLGDISEVRYANKALYTANFTPPSSAMSLDLFDESIIAPRMPTANIKGFVSQNRIARSIKIVPTLKGLAPGPGKIVGTVKEAHLPSDLPLSRRVRLHRKADGQLIDETWSNAAGNYAFTNIAIQKYYVVAFDHTDNYNAVIKDSITPVI